jgi:general stress protein CsbA
LPYIYVILTKQIYFMSEVITPNKVYPSKKGLVIYIPLLLLLVVEVVYIISRQYVAGLLSLTVIGAVVLPMYFNTNYTINADGSVHIKCGLFFNTLIPAGAIKKIKPTKTIFSAPALSIDRIEIFYNKFDSVVISPENKAEFIALLQSINPTIEYIPA